MTTLLLKWFGFNVDDHDRDSCNTHVDKAQPMPTMVVVVDVVAGGWRMSLSMMDIARG